MPLLILKLLMVPFLTAGVTLVGRRWGLESAARLASLPWVAGPISFFMALEQGSAFAASAAVGATWSVVGLAAFCLIYAWAAKRYQYMAGLFLAYSVYMLLAWGGTIFPLQAIPVYVVTIGCLAIFIRLIPVREKPVSSGKTFFWDIPLRMLTAAVFVWGLTRMAAWLGPSWTGVLTPFPILTSILAVFTHWQKGIQSAVHLLHHMAIGLTGFATFFFVVGACLPSWGIPLTFGIAACSSLLITWITYRIAGLAKTKALRA
jgi:hypothetical protein